MNSPLVSVSSLYCGAALLAVALFNGWTSRINQFFFFSRTAWPGFEQTQAARKIVRTYRMHVGLVLAAAVLVYCGTVTLAHWKPITGLLAALAIQSLLGCAAYAAAHKTSGKALVELRPAEQADTPQAALSAAVSIPLQAPGTLSKTGVVLLVLAPISALAVWVGTAWAEHMSSSGLMEALEANKAGFLNGLGLGMLFASLLVYVLVRYFSRHGTAMGRFTVSGALQLAWIGSLALIGSILTVPFHLVVTRGIRLAVMIPLLALVVLRLLYAWSRARMFPPAQVERNGDEFWRWGLFYCNPTDPTLFIQHRSGPGYTVNFANFIAWPLTLFFVADIAFLVYFSTRH